VADHLGRLPDDWVIRWGFHYQDNANQTREGDFLVLGSDVGFMVIEVKAALLHHWPPSGRWDIERGDHPLIQLDAEWKAVVRVINDQSNRQFVVQGGTGTGKTWLVLELARRWAGTGPAGSRVLFLIYNLALTDFIRDLVRLMRLRGRLPRGEIVVLSWEELARNLVTRAGLAYEVPPEGPERADFYTLGLPALLMQIVREGLSQPEFDAMAVDEAQDHDTTVADWPTDWIGPGWWSVYWHLLRERETARVDLAHDPGQRPQFRSVNAFESGPICRALRGNPVLIQLQRTLRYTRPCSSF